MYAKLATLLLTSCLLVSVQCQSPEANVKAVVESVFQNISGPLLDQVPELKNLNLTGLNVTNSLGKAEDVLRQKCAKNGGSYDVAKQAGMDLHKCAKGIVDVDVLKKEINDNMVTGDLDEVFKKYCRRQPEAEKCFHDFANKIDPCFEPVERTNKKIVENIILKILNFTCFNGGERIALFIAAKGPECFKAKSTSISDCAKNATKARYGKEINKDVGTFNPANGIAGLASLIDPNNLPLLEFNAKVCHVMKDTQTCSVTTLEGCEDPTPANLFDSISNFIQKVTPCEKLIDNPEAAALQADEPNSASINTAMATALLAALAIIFA